MGINIGTAYANASRLDFQSSTLSQMVRELMRFDEMLGYHWQASETVLFHNALARTLDEIRQEAGMLQALGADIRQVADEIRIEEEAAAAAIAVTAAVSAASRQAITIK